MTALAADLIDWSWMRRVCLATSVLAVIGGGLGYGSFGHFLVAVALLMTVGAPLSIWLLALLIWLALRRPALRTRDRGMVMLGPVLLMIALGIIGSWPPGS